MTQDTQQLIDSLVGQASPVTPMRAPSHLIVRMICVLLIYGCVCAFAMGQRLDLAAQLTRPFYVAEILLLLAITLSSVVASAYMTFPDEYQHPGMVRLPFYALTALVLLMAVQVFLPPQAGRAIPEGAADHGMDCIFCIASMAVIPSLLMFYVLKRGASAYPLLSGVYAVLASACIGCLVVRLEEADDSLAHLALWHYLPTLLFASLGALIGKKILKW